ncbi:MAG: hypothetical protein AAGD38_14645, partial [Acidobacteriota bacterium]
MDKRELTLRLLRLTGALEPAKGTDRDELRTTRELLAGALAKGRAHTAPDTDNLPPLAVADDVHDELGRLAALVAEDDSEEDGPPLHVVRRDLPFASGGGGVATLADLVAGGRRADRVLGPFIDLNGQPLVFDVFTSQQHVTIVRDPGGEPLLRVPVRAFQRRDAENYMLGAGSVWIRSTLLAPNAPPNGWTGLRILGGTVRGSAGGVFDGTVVRFPAGTKVELEIELDRSAPPLDGGAPGVAPDAAAAQVMVPATMQLATAPGQATQIALKEAALELFDVTYRMAYTRQAPVWESTVARILVPFDAEPDVLAIGEAKSKIFRAQGKEKLTFAGWVLPVTTAAVTSLGEADGAGGIGLACDAGMDAQWRGLRGGAVDVDGLFVIAEPGRLMMIGRGVHGASARQRFELWQEHQPSARRARFDMKYHRPGTVRFLAERDTREVLWLEGESDAVLDRPLDAAGRHLHLTAGPAMCVLELRTTLRALGQARFDGSSRALALRNALLTVAAPWLVTWNGELNGDRIDAGELRLLSRLERLWPTLPDPYASTMTPLTGKRIDDNPSHFTPTTGLAGLADGLARQWLVAATVTWAKPDDVTLELKLSKTATAEPVRPVRPGPTDPPVVTPPVIPGGAIGLVRPDVP